MRRTLRLVARAGAALLALVPAAHGQASCGARSSAVALTGTLISQSAQGSAGSCADACAANAACAGYTFLGATSSCRLLADVSGSSADSAETVSAYCRSAAVQRHASVLGQQSAMPEFADIQPLGLEIVHAAP
jgi:hypothetical protein